MARNNVVKFSRPKVETKVIGTKMDPDRALVPYGEYIVGALRPCQFCKHWFTYLGRKRHENACAENPEVIAKKRKAKVR